MKGLRISVLPEVLAICKLPPVAVVPAWVGGGFTSVTRTADELSIVCGDASVPQGVPAERGWRVFKVDGPLPFEMTGVAASLVGPLADARISVFLIATFDTDYLLVKQETLEPAAQALRSAGHEVS